MEAILDGCEECIPSWRTTRRVVYGDSTWVFYITNIRQSMSVEEISIWPETISKSLV
ncbi:hypothetical protein C2845_PM01G17040 [Panicum miliaceum]|uniref:Uncharacterized protein n=1 Tax=Panicum miliaceum TaxID=4540 RepID=A0A3L6TNL2_PANMI|nr:hypothetical protein C2845_PM01G17040 [Panicum miliaceum]